MRPGLFKQAVATRETGTRASAESAGREMFACQAGGRYDGPEPSHLIHGIV